MRLMDPRRTEHVAVTSNINMNSASNSGTQPMISHESALQLQNISKSYTADTKAVDGVDLEVRSGEFFSLLGPSGCGKTTILRMLAGFEVPTEGKLLVEGKDFTNVPPHRRGMSMVFQNYALFPHRTVMENVAFGLRMRRVDRQSIREKVQFALSMVSLTGLEQRKPAQLSGGQQQRVALARALVVEPKVLLCDEPLAALDKKLRQSMQIELKQLQQRLGVTLVFVTHDQEEALAMSDRIAVMNAGKLEQIGSPAEIYNRPRSCFVADFIGDTNLFKGEIEVQDGSQRLVVNEKFSIALPVCAKSVKPIAVALRPEKISLSPGGEGKSVKAKGTIEGIVFQGQGVLIRVLLEGGQRILAREANDGSPPRFQIHQPIDLDWASGDVTLLWK